MKLIIETNMNEIDAGKLAHELDIQCGLKSVRLKPPVARLLKDFNIDEEGYGIFLKIIGYFVTALKFLNYIQKIKFNIPYSIIFMYILI